MHVAEISYPFPALMQPEKQFMMMDVAINAGHCCGVSEARPAWLHPPNRPQMPAVPRHSRAVSIQHARRPAAGFEFASAPIGHGL
jgi:hypothetical protein